MRASCVSLPLGLLFALSLGDCLVEDGRRELNVRQVSAGPLRDLRAKRVPQIRGKLRTVVLADRIPQREFRFAISSDDIHDP